MADRNESLIVYLNEREKTQLKEWSNETGKSLSELGREAILEYTDHDRAERIEEKVDQILDHLSDSDGSTHTHTPQSPQSVPERARAMISRIQANHGTVVKEGDVKRAIEDYSGGDDRTVKQYKQFFRERGLLFEHPGETATWTTEVDQWLTWMEDYTRLNGLSEAEHAAEEYPAQVFENMDGTIRIEIDDQIKQE